MLQSAMTIAPVPAKTNAKVPTNSAKYFFMELHASRMHRPLHTAPVKASA